MTQHPFRSVPSVCFLFLFFFSSFFGDGGLGVANAILDSFKFL